MEENKHDLARRADELFERRRSENDRRTSRIFAILMAGQWVFGILVAILFSPSAWEGKVQSVHQHVLVAVLLGGALSSLPIYLALTRPSATVTRHVIAVAQMLWSAVLIHLSGGRIETHFHVFGSLAFLAFYRDWKVLVPATIVVTADHLARQMFWPESVYGIINPEWWRFIEHAFWVVFEDIVLVAACLLAVDEMRRGARVQAEAEDLSERERAKSKALNQALAELQASQEQLVRTEKLAAVGQLAASVGHELRNPLAAVRNANAYIGKKLRAADGASTGGDPKVRQFLDIMDRELGACGKIITDLLDFARERPLSLTPCPLPQLIDDAIGVLPAHGVTIETHIPGDLPVPRVDRDQFRQVLINVVQNAVEALDGVREPRVTVTAERAGTARWRISVADNGAGVPAETSAKIFEPLFTTKTKGTGLGLAIVATIVRRHNGKVWVEAGTGGKGAMFVIEWSEPKEQLAPPPAAPATPRAAGAEVT